MDLTTPLIFASLFLFASASLFVVYKYGIKKKSYEEVLAEHRKQASALLGPRPKLKEKKSSKKAAKKLSKEKAAAESEAVEEVNEAVAKNELENAKVGKVLNTKLGKMHVDFKEEPEEVPKEVPVVKVKEMKRGKKTRPILVKKSSDPEIVVSSVEPLPVTNHFEEIHPKDEFELLRSRSNSREEINYKTEALKEEKKVEKSLKKTKHQKHQSEMQLQQLVKNQTSECAPVVDKEKAKEEKVVEKTTITAHVQEPTSGPTKEKKKKKGDNNSRQQLIFREKQRVAERDQLIHSVRNAELSRTEVQLLIDLLLNKQLEAPAIIDEWSEGKSDPVQKLKKQLADKEKQLADEQETLTGVQAKLKEVRNEQQAERAQWQLKVRTAEESRVEFVAKHAQLQQKLQEFEDLRNRDIVNLQRIAEENKALQIQRGQLEATLMSYQETDSLIHTLKAENIHVTKQCQMLTQQRQEQDTNYQNCLLQIQTMERNHNFALGAQQEELRKKHEQQLNRLSELHLIEEQKLKDIINELQLENQKLQEETNDVQINGSSEENKEHEVKVLNLTNELSSVKSELNSVNQNFREAEMKYNSDITTSREMCDQLKKELEEQKNKNDDLRKKNWKVMEALNAAESRNKFTSANQEQDGQKEFIQRLFPEIESLKELSSRGDWQEEYERAIRGHLLQLEQKPSADVPDLSGKSVVMLHNEVQHYKQIIDETEGILKKLQTHIEEEERNWRSKLAEKDAEIKELRDQCVSQKLDAESIPNGPDSNGLHFAYKCIEKSLPLIIDELQVKVLGLENQLAQERADKLRLIEERQFAVERPEVKSIHVDPISTIEKLSDEDGLIEQLTQEQTKNSDAGIYQNGATS
ncbi:ribosome-binding protein 1 isoform X2 [Euwallacea fornicatus]|uniref:ribosome-binding protein 1 isoform X2 n=1 Tax=Euwallacea fornicatus TaxID=995702 RepID=UPI00338E382D